MLKRLLACCVALTILLPAGAAMAGAYEDGLKLVNDPARLATRMGDAKKLFRKATRDNSKNAHAWSRWPCPKKQMRPCSAVSVACGPWTAS